MTRQQNQHVVPSKNGWAVKRSGARKATRVFGTQRGAIAAARQIAANQKPEMLIHGRDGRIRQKTTYGHDPRASRG